MIAVVFDQQHQLDYVRWRAQLRDVLETQLEEVEQEGVELSADDLADIVYNLGLEQAGDDGLLEADRAWRPREHHDPWETNDADPDEVEDILDDKD